MSLFCDFCGTRVSSRASLAGHLRRKHPERVPAIRTGLWAAQGSETRQRARIAAGALVKGLSDSAYVAWLNETAANEIPASPVATEPEKRNFWRWMPLLIVAGLFVAVLFSPDSSSDGHSDWGLVSTYQPEGDGE